MVDKDKQMAQTSILEAMMMFKKPFRLDQNQKGGGILIYVSSNIPTKFLTKHSFPNDGYLSEHHPPSQNDQYHFYCFDKALEVYSSYEKVIVTGDFGTHQRECVFDLFHYQHDLTNLVKEGTCYKNPGNPSCIDLYLTAH